MPTCLVIAAHLDDIESWCASAVNALIRQGWRAEETRRARGLALAEAFKRLRL